MTEQKNPIQYFLLLLLVFTAVDRQKSLRIVLHWMDSSPETLLLWFPAACIPQANQEPGSQKELGTATSHPGSPKPSSLSLVGRAAKGLVLHPRLDGIVRSERVAVTGAIAREGRGDLSW